MNYQSLPAFERDFKKLLKKFQTLEGDFECLKRYHLEAFHASALRTDDPVPIRGACGQNFTSYKVRKFACRFLFGRGNKSGLRVIYVYHQAIDLITFVEIYYKADQASEDRERLRAFIKSLP